MCRIKNLSLKACVSSLLMVLCALVAFGSWADPPPVRLLTTPEVSLSCPVYHGLVTNILVSSQIGSLISPGKFATFDDKRFLVCAYIDGSKYSYNIPAPYVSGQFQIKSVANEGSVWTQIGGKNICNFSTNSPCNIKLQGIPYVKCPATYNGAGTGSPLVATVMGPQRPNQAGSYESIHFRTTSSAPSNWAMMCTYKNNSISFIKWPDGYSGQNAIAVNADHWKPVTDASITPSPYGTAALNSCPVRGENGIVSDCSLAYSPRNVKKVSPAVATTTVCNLTIDQCGVCGGRGDTCIDCAGIVNGNHEIDACGVCRAAGDPNAGQSCLGCDGVQNSNQEVDLCGVCGGNNDCLDCTDDIGGNAIVDVCGVCIDPDDRDYSPGSTCAIKEAFTMPVPAASAIVPVGSISVFSFTAVPVDSNLEKVRSWELFQGYSGTIQNSLYNAGLQPDNPLYGP